MENIITRIEHFDQHKCYINYDMAHRTWESLMKMAELTDDPVKRGLYLKEAEIFLKISETITLQSNYEYFGNNGTLLKALPFREAILDKLNECGGNMLPENLELTVKNAVVQDAELQKYEEDIFGTETAKDFKGLNIAQKQVKLLEQAVVGALLENDRAKAAKIVFNYAVKNENLTFTLMGISKSGLLIEAKRRAENDWNKLGNLAKDKMTKRGEDKGDYLNSRVPVIRVSLLESACHKYVNQVKETNKIEEFSKKPKKVELELNIGNNEIAHVLIDYKTTKKALEACNNSRDQVKNVINNEAYNVISMIQSINAKAGKPTKLSKVDLPVAVSELKKSLESKEFEILCIDVINDEGDHHSSR